MCVCVCMYVCVCACIMYVKLIYNQDIVSAILICNGGKWSIYIQDRTYLRTSLTELPSGIGSLESFSIAVAITIKFATY